MGRHGAVAHRPPTAPGSHNPTNTQCTPSPLQTRLPPLSFHWPVPEIHPVAGALPDFRNAPAILTDKACTVGMALHTNQAPDCKTKAPARILQYRRTAVSMATWIKVGNLRSPQTPRQSKHTFLSFPPNRSLSLCLSDLPWPASAFPEASPLLTCGHGVHVLGCQLFHV